MEKIGFVKGSIKAFKAFAPGSSICKSNLHNEYCKNYNE